MTAPAPRDRLSRLRDGLGQIFPWPGRLCFWLAQTLHPRRRTENLDEELAFHLEQSEALYRAQGLSPEEAHRRARIDFGSLDAATEETKRQRPGWWLASVGQDLRYGARLLRRSPTFTLVAALSLALAIGANTALFSIARQMIFSPLRVAAPAQLRVIGWNNGPDGAEYSYWSAFNAGNAGMRSECISWPVFQQLEARNHTLAALFAYKQFVLPARLKSGTQLVGVEMVSGDYYAGLGVRPQLGRLLTPEDVAGAQPVVVISDGLWRRQYDGSPAVLGQSIVINQHALTIVGINPRDFTGAASTQDAPELVLPLTLQPIVDPMPGDTPSLLHEPDNWWLEVMGRLKPGVPEPAAHAEMNLTLADAVRSLVKPPAGKTLPWIVLADGSRGLNQWSDTMGRPLAVLAGLAGLLLLLACANIANLLLARGRQRMREMGVRLALGAGRARLLRQLLTESLLLAALGGVGGLLLGYFGRNLLPSMLHSVWDRHPLLIHFDWVAFLYSAGVMLLAGTVFGLAPAWMAARAEVGSNLKESSSTLTRRRGRGLAGRALIVVQIALSTLLVIGAGLFLRTVTGLRAVDPGFDANHLLLAEYPIPPARYPGVKSIELYRRIEQAAAALPGVESASTMSMPFYSGGGMYTSVGAEPLVGEHPKSLQTAQESVGNAFFETMRLPIVAGRAFAAGDTATSTPVAIVNRRLANELFPGQNPIGRRLYSGRRPAGPEHKDEGYLIVGVAADTHYEGAGKEPPALLFFPFEQEDMVYGSTLVLRSSLPAEVLAAEVRRAVAQVDADLLLTGIRTQSEQMREQVNTQRLLAALASGFGVLALLLAAVGVYGVMAYSVERRTSEIGIRLALGAGRRQILNKILAESAWVAAAGAVVGLSAALALARLVRSMLYGVGPNDPLTLVSSVLLLLAVALAATFIPARRAARIEPMAALRHE